MFLRCGNWPLVHSLEHPWSSKSFRSERTACVNSMKFTVTKKSTLWQKLLLPFFSLHFPIGCNNRDWILGNPHGWQIRLNSDSFCSACALVLQYPLRTLSSGSIWWFEAPTLKKWNKVALPLSLNLKILFVSLHASPRVHRSCLSVSSWDWSSNFGAWGLTGALNHAKQWTFAHPKFGVPYRALWESSLCDLVSKLLCPSAKNWPEFRRLDVLKHATQWSCNPDSTNALLFSIFFSFFLAWPSFSWCKKTHSLPNVEHYDLF